MTWVPSRSKFPIKITTSQSLRMRKTSIATWFVPLGSKELKLSQVTLNSGWSFISSWDFPWTSNATWALSPCYNSRLANQSSSCWCDGWLTFPTLTQIKHKKASGMSAKGDPAEHHKYFTIFQISPLRPDSYREPGGNSGPTVSLFCHCLSLILPLTMILKKCQD